VDRSCSDNILNHVDSEGNSLCRGNCPLSDSMKDKIPREVKVYLHHKNSHCVPVSARTRVLIDDNENINAPISVKAILVKNDDTIESLMKRADSFMYKSKQAGKNRLTLG
jgi:GGDEF domain-containing protein